MKDRGARTGGWRKRSRAWGARPLVLLCALLMPSAALAIARFESTPPTTAMEGREYVYHVVASGEGEVTVTAPNGLPPWLTLVRTGNGRYTLSGTPGAGETSGSVFLRATDQDPRLFCRSFPSFCSDTQSFVISILQPTDLELESITADPAPALVEQSVEWTLRVRNGGPGGSPPAELEIDFAGAPFTVTEHSCSAGGQGQLLCAIEPLGNGEAASVRLTGFAPEPGDVYVTAVVASSFDSDPRNDFGAGGVSVAVELGADAAQTLTGAGLAVAAGDVDADGFDDLAVAAGAGTPLRLHLNVDDPASLHAQLRQPGDSRRGLSTMPLSLGEPQPHQDVVLADLDGDGHLDAVAAAGPGAASSAYFVDGAGALRGIVSLGDASDDSRAVAAADLTGDGHLDLVFANAGPSRVFLNRGAGDLEEMAAVDDGLSSRAVAVATFTNGLLPDVVFANDDGDARLYRNLGEGRLAELLIIETGPTVAVAAGDFNGDGLPDLVFARVVAGPSGVPSNPVYLNDGAGGFELAEELGAAETLDIVVADFTEDGVPDVVFVNAGGAHQLYVGDGRGGFELHSRQLLTRGALRGTAGRFALDGRLNLALMGEEGASVFFNDGHGNLGLGVTARPVIELLGAPEMSIEVGSAYQDPGAIARDAAGEPVQPVVENKVDTSVVGTYAVTYHAIDRAGNAAAPVERTVRVEVRTRATGGGGGALGLAGLLGLCLLLALQWVVIPPANQRART